MRLSQFWSVAGSLFGVLVVATLANGQSLAWSYFGSAANDTIGLELRLAGDIDGDGKSEVAVGAPVSTCGGLASGFVQVVSGIDGAGIWSACGSGTAYSGFGARISLLGDVDLDGVNDLIIGAKADGRNASSAGAVTLCSGADGRTIREHFGGQSFLSYGSSVAGISDLDGDGIGEYLIGGTDAFGPGVCDLYSGATGTFLVTLAPDGLPRNFGASCIDAGDLNGDGLHDLLVGDWGAKNAGTDSGSVHAFSGADGSILYRLDGAHADAEFGSSLDRVGDVDADGVDDFIVGAPDYQSFGTLVGAAYVHSGRTGAQIMSFEGSYALGSSVAGVGDINQDGVPDFMAADGSGSSIRGEAFLYSGNTGNQLYHWEGTVQYEGFGSAIAGGADFTGDNKPDIVISTPGYSAGGLDDLGRVECFSISPFFCDLSDHDVHVSQLIDAVVSETKPGNYAGLAIVAVDGIPLFSWIALAPTDSLGRLLISGQIPPEAAGSTFTLKAYAIGFNGKLVASADELLVVAP